MDRDKNLLFGIFAAQLKGVRAERIIEAGAAWATDPSRPLSDRLLDLGAIDATDRELLDRLVAEAIRAHGGDATEALSRLGGVEQVERAFSGSLRVTPGGSLETVTMDRGAPQAQGPLQLNISEETPGRYSRISVYGKGGMGRVLLVHDENMDRDIAMKELLPHPEQKTEGGWTPVGHTASMVARFLREARLTGLLEHPSIVPVYELGRREDGSLYYTMKLVRGKTLLQAIRAEKLLEGRLKLLPHFLDLCQAIAYAHSRGIIHRDIKPANVMIGDFGETVVLDWGIAKSQGREDLHEEELSEALTALKLGDQEYSLETGAGEALGTPHYMPPEQAEGRIQDIDMRSDVYSLGAVLYELLTAKTPYSGRTTREILQRVIKEEFQHVRKIVADAPPELVSICEKCLSKHPEERYQSAKEVADEVERFLSGALVRSFKYNPGQLLLHYYRRHQAVLNTAFAGAAALLLVAAYSYVSLSRAYFREQDLHRLETKAREEAVAAREKETDARKESEHQEYLAEIRLSGNLIQQGDFFQAEDTLWGMQEALRNWEWGWLLNLCHQDRLTFTHGDSVVIHAGFSPNGDKLITVNRAGAACLWETDSGQRLREFNIPGLGITVAAWTASGDRLAFALNDGSVQVFNPESGEALQKLDSAGAPLEFLEVDASGDTLLAVDARGVVLLYTSPGSAPRELFREPAGVWRAHFLDDTRVLVQTKNDRVLALEIAGGTPLFELGGALATLLPDRTGFLLANAETMEVHDATGGQLLRAFPAADDKIRWIAVSPDGQRFAALARNELLVWQGSAQDPAFRIESEDLASVAFSADGKLLTGYDTKNEVVVWDASSGRQLRTLRGHSGAIGSLALHPSRQWALTAARDAQVKLWDLEQGFATTEISAAVPLDARIAVPRDAQALFCGDAYGPVRKLDRDAGQWPLILGSASLFSSSFAVTPAGDRVAMVLDNFVPAVFDVPGMKMLSYFPAHGFMVTAIDLRPDGLEAVSADFGGAVRTWNVETGAENLLLADTPGEIRALRYSPDGIRILAVTPNAAVLWNAGDGKELCSLAHGDATVRDAVWSPDGRRVATAATDKFIRLWNAASGTLEKSHASGVQTAHLLQFNPAGDRLVATLADGSGVLIETETGIPLLPLSAPVMGGTRFAFSGDGLSLHTTSGTQAVLTMHAAPWTAAAYAGIDGGSWREKLNGWVRKTHTAQPSGAAPGGTLQLRAISEEQLRGAVERIAQLAPAAGPAGEGCRIPGGEDAAVFQALCLASGDILTEINTADIETMESAKTALMQALAAPDPLLLEFQHDGLAQTARLHRIPTRAVESTVSVDRATLLAWIQHALDAKQSDAARQQFVSDDLNKRNPWRQHGSPPAAGLWLNNLKGPAEHPVAEQLGLGDFDHIVAINGTPLAGPDEAWSLLEKARAFLSSGGAGACSLEVERGAFQHVLLTIEVQG